MPMYSVCAIFPYEEFQELFYEDLEPLRGWTGIQMARSTSGITSRLCPQALMLPTQAIQAASCTGSCTCFTSIRVLSVVVFAPKRLSESWYAVTTDFVPVCTYFFGYFLAFHMYLIPRLGRLYPWYALAHETVAHSCASLSQAVIISDLRTV